MKKNKSTNATTEEDSAITSRRKFLKKLIYGSVLAMSGCGVETAAIRHVSQHGFAQQTQAPAPYLHSPGYKTLSFEHTHTGEKLRLTYFERGDYIKEALLEINYLLRDFRTDDIYPNVIKLSNKPLIYLALL